MKEKPEKFQDCPDMFDLIITVEERIYDSVVEGKQENLHSLNIYVMGDGFLDFQSRSVTKSTPAHVLNIEIKDNHEDATLGAFLICELCQMVGTCRTSECCNNCVYIL